MGFLPFRLSIYWYYRFSHPFSSLFLFILFIPLYSTLKNVLSISSRTLWNVRMLVSISSLIDQFWNIVLQFRDLSPIFVNCNSNSSVTVVEHKTAKSILSIGIHFCQSLTQIRLPDIRYNAVIIALIESFTSRFNTIVRCLCVILNTMSTTFNKGYKISRENKKNKWLYTWFTLNIKARITLDEFEWRNGEFIWEKWRIDSSIPTSISDRDKFQWQLTNLNA